MNRYRQQRNPYGRRDQGRRRQPSYPRRGGFGQRSGGKLRLLIGLGIAIFSVISYFGSKSFNPVTGEKQYLSMTPHQEVALGLQAAPQMIEQHGGLYPSQREQDVVDRVGQALVRANPEIPNEWEFEFHLLRDPRTINAFALPGGQCFITYALYSQLQTEGQLAGVLGHEIGHVVARHGAQRMAKGKLTQGLIGAVATASSSQGSAQMAAMIGNLINMKYGRGDELQSDKLGIIFMSKAGYNPSSMIGVMEILAKAGGGNGKSEFFSTHPNPENRIGRIQESIKEIYPNGPPRHLRP